MTKSNIPARSSFISKHVIKRAKKVIPAGNSEGPRISSMLGCTFLLIYLTVGCHAQQGDKEKSNSGRNYEIVKTEEEWKEVLSAEEYHVLREKGTEQAFTGEYNKHDKKGTYLCAACQNELFASETKYDSHSGWPSFYEPITGNVEVVKDHSHGMVRDEVVCASCGSHLGHVFPDGPKPTGLRYCVNSVALDFREE